MADMILTKPAAGAQDIVNAQPDARLLLDFPAGDATLERSGDDLIFRFADGSSLVLRDFYTSYTRENMPDFVIDGTPVSGEEFFTALNDEDLMPAAGPTASNADGGRFREYTDDPLQVGVDRLGGLDLGSGRAFYPERDPLGGLDDGATPLPNRAPIINLAGGVGVAEAGVHPGGNDPYEGVPLVTGRVVATDDDGDVLAYGFINASGQRVTTIATEHGSITIAQDGTFTYTLDNADPDTNGLALGETATETFTVFVDDGRGGFITQPITVTITGTNDRPELSITGSGQGVAEEGAQSVTGTFAVADPDSDAGRDQTFHIDSANGGTGTDGTRGENGSSDASFTTDYGTLTLNPATGEWEYTLNNTGDAVQKLGEGESKTETFTVTVTDEHGATSQQTITVTITGTNDAPVISGTDDLTLKETGVRDGGNDATLPGEAVTPAGDEHKLIATGKIDASDIDSDDDASSLDYKLQGADGNPADSIETGYGTVSIKPDGTYTYELKDGTANHLAQGESVTETITVMVTDSHGETVTKDVTVTIYGTNDQPTLSLNQSTLDVVESGVGRIDADTVVEDGTPDQENAEYKGQISAGGTATGADADDGASLTYGLVDEKGQAQYAENGPVTSGGKYGTLTIKQDGSYTYVLDDGKSDSLNEGEKQSETFTVYVRDEHGAWAAQEITVNITGTNDRPELKIDNAAQSLVEDAATSTVSGTFTVTDKDADGKFGEQTGGIANQRYSIAGIDGTTGSATDSPTAGGPATFTTAYGTLTVNPDGTWTYALDDKSEKLHALKEGETRTETFNVTVTDVHGANHTQPITVNITGTNDAPTITPVTEHVKDTGVFGVVGDKDNGPNSATGDYSGPGGGHVNDGEQRLEAEGQLQGFDAEGDPLTYGVKTDGITAGGTLTLTKPDNPADKTTIDVVSVNTDDKGTTTIETEVGKFILKPNGSYSFELITDADGFVDKMAQGEKWNLTFDVTASDGKLTGHSTLTICIEGTNEQPTFTQLAHKDYLGKEQAPIDASGTWVVEAAEQGRWRGNQGNSNRVSDHSDVLTGRFGADDRDNGESAKLTFGAEFKDGSTRGGNKDALEALGDLNLKSVEERTVTKPTQLAEHADKGHPNQYAELAPGEYKVFHFDVGDFYLNVNTGEYYFDVNDKSELVNRMNLGDTHSLNFTITVTDEHGASATMPDEQGKPTEGHQFTINITGRNDRPELTVEQGISTTDGQTATGSLKDLVEVNDADFGDSHKFFIVDDPTANGTNPDKDYSGTTKNAPANKLDSYKPDTTLEGKYGTLTIDPATGEYTYKLYTEKENPDAYNAVKSLPEGAELEDEVFHIAVQDSHGAFDIKKLPITITGVNDKPVVNGFNVDVKEDGVYTDGKGNMHDTGLMTDTSYQGNIGNEVHKLAATGNVLKDKGWGGKPIVSDVDAGDKLTVDIRPNYDGDNSLNFSLTHQQAGVDASGLTPKIISSELENGIRTIVTNYGTLTLNTKTGEYNFTLSDSALGDGGFADRLAHGQKLTLSFTLTATDALGQTAQHTMGVNIQGANDVPTLTITDKLLEVTEAGAQGEGTPKDEGQARGADDDYGAKLTYTFLDKDGKPTDHIDTEYGTLHIDSTTGKYWFELDNTLEATQKLTADDDIDLKGFTVRVIDEHGAYANETIDVRIHGSNDAPTAGKPNLILKEEGVHDGNQATEPSTKNPANGEHRLTASGQITVTDVDDTVSGGNYATAEDRFKFHLENANHIRVNEDRLSAEHLLSGGGDFQNVWDHIRGKDGSSLTDAQLDALNTAIQKAVESGSLTVGDELKALVMGPDFNIADLDDTQGKAILSQVSLGRITLDGATGEFTFEMAKKGSLGDLINNLFGANYHSDHTFSVTVSDPHGATTGTSVNVSIRGTNDRPELTLSDRELAVTENSLPSAEGSVTVADPDADDHHTFGLTESTSLEGETPAMSTSMKGDYGTLTIDPKTGKYTYTLDERAEALGQGVKAGETFHVIVKDANGAFDIKQVTVDITGTADAAKLTSTDAHVIQITEAGMAFNTNDPNKATETAGGKFEVNPVDAPDAGGNHLHYGFMVNGTFHEGSYTEGYVSLTIDENGKYTVMLTEAANELPAGALKTLKNIQLAVRDDRHPEDMTTTQKLEIYIHGSNDRPYFTDGAGNEIKPNEQGEIVFTAQPDEGSGPLVEGGNNILKGHLAADDPDKDHNPGDLRYSIVLDLDGDGKADRLVQTVEGKYGTLELHEDGTYTYTITNPEGLEALNFGQSLIESALEQEIFDIRITDPDNAYTDGKLTIDVTGTKDERYINEVKLEISEDDGVVIDHAATDPAIKGTFTLTDIVDAEDTGPVTWSNEGPVRYAEGSGNQPLGTLTVNANGTYTYTLTENGSDLVQAMNEGQIKTETFKVQAQIKDGKTVEKEITVTIHGTNDKPVIDTKLAPFEGEVTRDVFDDNDPTDMGEGVTTGVIFKGELKGGATDVDNPNEQLKYMLVGADGQPVSELKTDYGTITLTHIVNKDGSISTSYTYTLDNESQKLIDALKENPDGLFDKVEIVAVDPLGAVSDEKGTINIKINPEDAGGGPGAAIELDPASDLKATVKEDGTKPTPDDPIANEAPSVTGHLEAKWADGHPGDAPDHVFGIKGDDGQQVQGHVAVDGKYGHLVINPATGEYTYTLYNGENGKSNPVQDLAEGEVAEEDPFEIMLNGKPTGEKLTITIKGTNDAPTISTTESDLHGEVTEDAYTGWAGKSFSGTVKGTDIDHRLSDEKDPVTGKPVFDQDQSEQVYYRFAQDVKPSGFNEGMPIYTLTLPEGTVTLDSGTGQYTFMADPGYFKNLHLVAGESKKVDFQIVATDGKANSEPATITIDLQGVNHAPRLTFSDLNIEDVEDWGQPIVTDLKRNITEDKGFDNLTFSVDGKTVAHGEYGTLVVNKDGTCTYTLNNADDKVQGLDEDHSGYEEFTITITDSDDETATLRVKVTVRGENDAPQVTVGEVIKAVEGSDEAYTGKVTAYDKDTVDQAEGALKYAFDAEAVAEHNETASDAEKWTLNADGSLTTQYGTYTIDQNGNYTFKLDNEADAVRGLAAGTLTEQKVTVVVTDTQGNPVTQEVTVNISGQNTAPDFTDAEGKRLTGDNVTLEANKADSPLVEKEGAEVTGKFGFTDPDDKGTVDGISVNGTAISAEDTVITGTYGTLTINPDGSYTYKYTSDALGEGATASETFTVTATDNYGVSSTAKLVVNLEGTNDAPVITSKEPTFNITEPADTNTATVEGTLSFTDADLTDSHTATVNKGEAAGNGGEIAGGTYGKLVIDGVDQNTNQVRYHYELTSDALGDGETAEETFTITVNDGTDTISQTVTVNVTGTNDAPVIETASAPTDGVNGSFSFSDADVSDTHSLSVLIGDKAYEVNTEGKCTVDGVGTFTFTANGGPKDWSYTFTPDKELTDTERLGQSGEVDFQIQVSDGHEAVNSAPLTLTFQGTNEVPEINATPAGAEGILAVTGGDLLILAVVDKDGKEITRLGDDETQDVTIDGHTVTFTRQADGSYKYELDGGSAHVGEKAEVSFSIQATDHAGPVTTAITLVAEGTQNDAPTASGGTQGMSLPSMLVPSSLHPGGDVPSVNGQLADSDPDGDSLTYAAGSLTGTYGGLVLNDDGSYTYTLDMSGENLVELVMQRGGTLTETFTYTVSDGHGGSSEGQITVNLDVPDDFSTMSFRGAAPFGHAAGNDDAAHASGGENPQETDSLDTHNTDGGNPLHTDGPDAHAASNALGTDTLSEPGADSKTLHTDGLSEPGADGKDLLGTNGLFGTDGLDGPDADKPLHTDGPAQTGTGDAGNGGHDAASSHAQSALSGGENADHLLGASPFTEDDFGDEDIFGTAAQEVFSPTPHAEGFYADKDGLTEAGQLLETPDNSLDGVLAPSDGQHNGTDGPDLDLTNLQPGEDLGGGSMPGLVLTQTMPDSPDMALAAGAPIPGAEDSLAHQQAMHEVNHSNG